MKNILLVDDDELTREEFDQIFKGTSYKLHFAVNCIEGLEFINHHDCDLVLLDIIMPDFNMRQSKTAGIELLRSIVEIKPELPVIMNSVIDEMLIEAFKLGAKDYIVKHTITKEELLSKVENVLDSKLMALINGGESLKLEFKSSMRWNYKANKIDKENMGRAWLKTIVAFLNTEGGTLLIGVSDDGCILGIEADNFPSEDKYLLHFTNLINQHIGLAFSKFIKAELIPINGKKVLSVQCEKSKKPVFLKMGKDEEDFYIRVGPTCRKLSVSKTLEYLENRKD